MTTDSYTRVVLTVIALALVALVIRPSLEPAPAGAQMGWCGGFGNPCYVTTDTYLQVWVANPTMPPLMQMVVFPKNALPLPVRIEKEQTPSK